MSGARSLCHYQNVAIANALIASSQTCWEHGWHAPLSHQQFPPPWPRLLESAFLPGGPMREPRKPSAFSEAINKRWGEHAVCHAVGPESQRLSHSSLLLHQVWPTCCLGTEQVGSVCWLSADRCVHVHISWCPWWGSSWFSGDLRPWTWDTAAISLTPSWARVTFLSCRELVQIHAMFPWLLIITHKAEHTECVYVRESDFCALNHIFQWAGASLFERLEFQGPWGVLSTVETVRVQKRLMMPARSL